MTNVRRSLGCLAAAPALALALAGCAPPAARERAVAYAPRVREITITTVPLLVRESEKVYPFLHAAFAKGGALEGHEVYAFSPSTIVAVEGDTLHLTLVNPEDDLHTFVVSGLALTLPGNSTTHAVWVARRPGIFPIVCNVPTHMPMMSGQIVVLAPAAVAGEGADSAGDAR